MRFCQLTVPMLSVLFSISSSPENVTMFLLQLCDIKTGTCHVPRTLVPFEQHDKLHIHILKRLNFIAPKCWWNIPTGGVDKKCWYYWLCLKKRFEFSFEFDRRAKSFPVSFSASRLDWITALKNSTYLKFLFTLEAFIWGARNVERRRRSNTRSSTDYRTSTREHVNVVVNGVKAG